MFCVPISILIRQTQNHFVTLQSRVKVLHSRQTRRTIMNLPDVVKQFQKLAPLKLAESWDNVGLLVEPTAPHKVVTLMLTNDLTEPVLDEALRSQCDMILSYHPPIFRPLKRLTQSDVKERIVVKCIEHRIAIFSPHTSYDAVNDGVNDWLISSCGKFDKEHKFNVARAFQQLDCGFCYVCIHNCTICVKCCDLHKSRHTFPPKNTRLTVT